MPSLAFFALRGGHVGQQFQILRVGLQTDDGLARLHVGAGRNLELEDLTRVRTDHVFGHAELFFEPGQIPLHYGNAEAHVGVFLVGLHFQLEFLRIQFLELGIESGNVVLNANQLLLDGQGLLFRHQSLGQTAVLRTQSARWSTPPGPASSLICPFGVGPLPHHRLDLHLSHILMNFQGMLAFPDGFGQRRTGGVAFLH